VGRPPPGRSDRVLALQRAAGNRAVSGLLQRTPRYEDGERERSRSAPGVAVRSEPGPVVPHRVHLHDFAPGSDAPRPRHTGLLSALLTGEHAGSRARVTSISGHTDAVGEEPVNRDLRDRRARAVASFMAANGMAQDRIGPAAGAPAGAYLADNETPLGRATNRAAIVELAADPQPERDDEPPRAPRARAGFGRVRGAYTSNRHRDRIPPRVMTPVELDVTGLDPARGAVTVAVIGDAGANGSVTIDGGPRAEVHGPERLEIVGLTQGMRRDAAGLRLVAYQGTGLLGMSDPFSVSAVPHSMDMTLERVVRPRTTDSEWGVIVRHRWQSDSGVLADLDRIRWREELQNVTATGRFFFIGWVGVEQGADVRGDDAGVIDTITVEGQREIDGRIVTHQVMKYRDLRNDGDAWTPIRGSGYRMEHVQRSAFLLGTGMLHELTAGKTGQALNVHGLDSSAGGGQIVETQLVSAFD